VCACFSLLASNADAMMQSLASSCLPMRINSTAHWCSFIGCSSTATGKHVLACSRHAQSCWHTDVIVQRCIEGASRPITACLCCAGERLLNSSLQLQCDIIPASAPAQHGSASAFEHCRVLACLLLLGHVNYPIWHVLGPPRAANGRSRKA
jgi:hypothetical protein